MKDARGLWLAAVLLAVAPLVADYTPFYKALLTEALVFGLFALAYDILLGNAGVLSLGHSAFFGVAAYSIVRDTEPEALAEKERITDVKRSAAGYHNYQQWLAGTQLEQQVSLEDYSVSNRGLRSGLVGTPAQVQDRIGEFEAVGVDFFLLQCSPQLEEMERFADAIIAPTA